MLNDTVSIIVPIYNKEKYLEKQLHFCNSSGILCGTVFGKMRELHCKPDL